jgi:protein-tyrosine phosphatase
MPSFFEGYGTPMAEVIDFHAHILPHMDHGSVRTAGAVSQLAILRQAGVDEVCATSHFYPQDVLPEVFLHERKRSLECLLNAYGHEPRPRILLGGEVLICPGLENMEGLRELCVEGTNVMLLEMPFTHGDWDRSLYRTVYEIRKMGIVPVLAHVDRYPRDSIERLFEMGVNGQINCGSLIGLFKPKHLLRWIEEGRIVALGSDLHGHDPKSYAPFIKVMNTMTDHADRVMSATATLLKDAKRY